MAPVRWFRSSSLVLVAALVVGGCSSSGSRSATPSTAAAAATTAVPVAGPVDCAAVQKVLGTLGVNWQVIVQLPNEPDVRQWAVRTKSIDTLKGFAGELDVLQAQLGRDAAVAAAVTFMRGASAIVQNGLGGDPNAPKELKEYLGADVQASMIKPAPIAQALTAAGC